MREKCNTLARWSFVIAVTINILTYLLFHYMGADCCLGPVYHKTAEKPFVTLLVGVWGMLFHFAAVMSWLIGKVFFSEK